MMRTGKYISVCILLTVLLPAGLSAQNGGFAGSSTRLGFGPRAMSMGNAYSAVTSQGIYSYYNPALAAINGDGIRQIDITASSLQFDRIFQSAGVKFDLPPNAGLAFGITRTGVKGIDERTLSGYPLGEFDLAEYQLLTSFGLQVSSRFNAGISFKLSYADYHPELTPATSVGVDLGMLYEISVKLNLAFVIQDMFANYTWNSSDLYSQSQSRNVVNSFPTRFKWALAWQQDEFTLSSEFEVRSQSSEITTTEVFISNGSTPGVIEVTDEITTSSGIFRIGGAWNAHERFTLRGGYRIMDTSAPESNSFTAGFSVHLPFDVLSPSIDYAFVTEPNQVANMHIFALRLHL